MFSVERRQQPRERQRYKSPYNELLDPNLDVQTKYDVYVSCLGALANDKKGLPELGMSGAEIATLARHASNQRASLDKRLEIFKRTLPKGKDHFEWVVGGDLLRLERFKQHTNIQLTTAVKVLLGVIPGLADTPKGLFPEPAPLGAILKEEMLDEAFYYVVLSGEKHSVASQIEDPIEHSGSGVVIDLRASGHDDEINRGYKLPVKLLEILKSLKYLESEKILAKWILQQCSKTQEDFEVTMRFLHIFVNFTPILDSEAHMRLWKPPIELPSREREFLEQAFLAMLGAVEYARVNLKRANVESETLNEFTYLEKVIKMRFGQIFNPEHKTSRYSLREAALTPTPEDFADYAFFILSTTRQSDHRRVAASLVKNAECTGIKSIEPLLKKVEAIPEMHRFLTEEARAAGLIKNPSAVKELYQNLVTDPWYDLGEIDLSKVLDINTEHLMVYVFTGTFGPYTKGHKELVQRLLTHLDLLPQTDQKGRIVQRIILICPMMSPAGIPNYPKIPSRVGTLDERVSSIILQAASFNKKKVFITTLLQPDPVIPYSVEDRVEDTINGVRTKAFLDLRKAQRRASINVSHKYVFGQDALRWGVSGKEIILLDRENQPGRVVEEGGLAVARRGGLLSTLTNLERMRANTGLETVILTPGTPFSSSSAAITEILKTDTCNYFDPGALPYILRHWNKEAIGRRRGISPTHYRSVNQIYLSLLEEMKDLAA